MIRNTSLIAGALLAFTALQPAALQAQTTTSAAPEPARLRAAQALLTQLMPPERRDAMIDQTVRPMIENIRVSMMASPMFKEAKDDPNLTAAIDSFVSGEMERTILLTKRTMPGMMDAMARAYARRLTLAQLNEVSAFYASPAGKAFAAQAPTIMADPDVLAAQRAMMGQAMEGIQERAMAFASKLAEQQEHK